jgi:DNA (cytosine-5)-methyltransferase 1
LERMGYEVGGADLCSAGIGAPHIRQRLWWVACKRMGRPTTRRFQNSQPRNLQSHSQAQSQGSAQTNGPTGSSSVDAHGLEHSQGHRRKKWGPKSERRIIEPRCGNGGLANMQRERFQRWLSGRTNEKRKVVTGHAGRGGATSPWDIFSLIPCADGKARRIEPGTFPLAHGVPARVGRLRGYGNAINPWQAAVFVRAFMEYRGLV